MKGPARNFFTLAVIYAILGILLGLQMAITTDHGEKVTHAHIMLAGWASMALFAYFYHLFPAINAKGIATVHFWIQAVASVVTRPLNLAQLSGRSPMVSVSCSLPIFPCQPSGNLESPYDIRLAYRRRLIGVTAFCCR